MVKSRPMPKPIKTCYFQIDGPIRRQDVANGWGGVAGVRTLLDYPDGLMNHSPNEIVELPRVRFQAEMTFVRVNDKRIVMKDRFGRMWSVYGSYIDQLVPLMTKGVIECWWTIVKRGSMYGIVADVESPLGSVSQDEDVPLMLETAYDLRSLVPNFEALAA